MVSTDNNFYYQSTVLHGNFLISLLCCSLNQKNNKRFRLNTQENEKYWNTFFTCHEQTGARGNSLHRLENFNGWFKSGFISFSQNKKLIKLHVVPFQQWRINWLNSQSNLICISLAYCDKYTYGEGLLYILSCTLFQKQSPGIGETAWDLQLYLNETPAHVISFEFCVVSQGTYLQNVCKRLFLLFFSIFTSCYGKSCKTMKTSDSVTM